MHTQDRAAVEPYTERGGELDIRRHLGILRGRFWTIFAASVAVFTVAAVHTFRATPIYQASARLLIERRLPQAMPFGKTEEHRDKEYFATQVELIKSKSVLQKALQNERVSLGFEESDLGEGSQGGLLHSVAREFRSIFGEARVRPKKPWETLREMVTVRPIQDTDLVEVRVESPDPGRSALIANNVAQAYVEHSVAMRRQNASETFEMLQKQMSEQQKAVVQAEDKLLDYQEEHNVSDLSAARRENPVLARWRMLNDEYTNVQLRRIELGVAVEVINKRNANGQDVSTLLAVSGIRKDPAVRQIYEGIRALQMQRKAALRSYGKDHPDVVSADDQIAYLQNSLREAISRVVQSIQAEHAMLLAREKGLHQALDEGRQRALDQVQKAHVYERYERDANRQSRVFEVIVDRMREVDLTKEAGITNVSLAETAVAPQSPVRPNKKRALILGAFLGLFLGIGLAYGLEFLDDTVKTPDDVEDRLNLPWLGYVPEMKGAAARDGFPGLAQQALLEPSSSNTEAFRSIRTNIYFSGERGEMKSVMVTSAAPREGKTVFASNLATTVARDGKRVLLVDADLRRPMIHKAFDLDRSAGLTNLLVESRPLQELVQTPPPTDGQSLENLDILCAGSKAPNPAELLGGEAMGSFLRRTRQDYDMVIYDSCPAMFVADAAALASECDGVVMVLQAARSRRKAAQQACKQLEAVDGKVIGVVLNQVKPKTMRSYGSYGAYYYYYDYHGSYGDYQDDEQTSRLGVEAVQRATSQSRNSGRERNRHAEGRVSFLIRSRGKDPRSFSLGDGQEVVLGQDRGECDFCLTGDNISNIHCRIAYSGGKVIVKDLGSAHGTYVNDEAVAEREVSQEDIIRLGSFQIVIGEEPSEHEL